MAYIPNVRNKEKELQCKNTKGAQNTDKENAYWEGYLDEAGSLLAGGYDEAVEKVDRIFFNTGMFEPTLEACGLDPDAIDEAEIAQDRDLEDYTDTELDGISTETKLLIGIRQQLMYWLESHRNELVVSLIECIDEKDYEKNKKLVDEKGYKNYLLRLQAQKENNI